MTQRDRPTAGSDVVTVELKELDALCCVPARINDRVDTE